MIENFLEITKEGEAISPEWRNNNFGSNFKMRLIIGSLWEFNGERIEKKYSYSNTLTLVNDFSGVIAIERVNPDSSAPNTLVFFEPDGSERFRIIPPIVSEWSNPEKAHFYYVQFLKNGECECVFDDGHDEYRSRLSLVNGEVSDLRKTRV